VLKLPAIMSQEFKCRVTGPLQFEVSTQITSQLFNSLGHKAQILRQLLPLLSPDIGMGGDERAVAMLALIEQEGRTAQQIA